MCFRQVNRVLIGMRDYSFKEVVNPVVVLTMLYSVEATRNQSEQQRARS